MDATVEAGVEEVVLVKGTQSGGSECTRNVMGYWIDMDPGPCLLVMPDEKSAEDCVSERIRPMLRHSPALARHTSNRREDNKISCIKLDTMPIYIGWSGSAQSLATRPCRYVIFDECDKYADFAGEEADPISLGEERTKTYLHRKKRLKISTPTTGDGNILKAFSACGDKRWFHLPCPHCGAYQRLVWSQTKYPKLSEPDKVKRADMIEAQRLAWYECLHCKGKIEDRHKPAMLSRGVWLGEHQRIDNAGKVSGECATSKRVGFHLNSLYSPWVTFSDMAAKWILAENDPGKTMNFRNSWLAEADEQVQTKIRPSLVRDKIALSGPALVVPSWAAGLFATADTQKDHFYFTLRAWGYGFRSALVHFGMAQTFGELYRVCLESVFKNESGMDIRPHALLIDSGGTKTNGVSRTDEVYEFATRDPGRIFPTKGASHPMRRPNSITRVGNAGVNLYLLDTNYYKDMLARLLVGTLESGVQQWLPSKDATEDYCLQMASEHKVRDRKTGKMSWVPVSQGAANHFWDCEVLQCAVAEISNVAITAPVAETPAPAGTHRQREGDGNWVTGHKGRW